MNQHRRFLIAGFLLILCIGALSSAPMVRGAADTLPTRLDDKEFWQISEQFSEPNGFFRSDNLLSNEMGMQYVIPDLIHRTGPGGVYMGVGPEQNFTYITALKPKMVFITDIRRGNLHTQLMYKALFELSANRAEFVSRLFTKKRPVGLETSSTVDELFKAFSAVATGDEAAYKENFRAIVDLLVKKHKLPLSDDDQTGIEYVYHSFYTFGPTISYNSTGRGFGGGRGGGGRGGNFTTYADLMTQTDKDGVNHGFLANEENFKVMRNLEEKNLLVPLVGDFGGPKAIRAVGKYLKEHGATVTAFYLSNVEQYLGSNWNDFCANVASLPLDEKSTFIRSSRGGYGGGPGYGLATSLGGMLSETKACSDPGKLPVVTHNR